MLFNAGGLYLALHQADPTVLGDLDTEAAGGGYIRQPISLSIPGSKTVASTNGQLFSGLPELSVTDLAVWTDVSAGDLVVVKHLPTPVSVPLDGIYRLPRGGFAVSL